MPFGYFIDPIFGDLISKFFSCLSEKDPRDLHSSSIHEFYIEHFGLLSIFLANELAVIFFNDSADDSPSVHSYVKHFDCFIVSKTAVKRFVDRRRDNFFESLCSFPCILYVLFLDCNFLFVRNHRLLDCISLNVLGIVFYEIVLLGVSNSDFVVELFVVLDDADDVIFTHHVGLD